MYLTNGAYQQYKKPNDFLLYVNTSSNRPTQVIKHLPISINKSLNEKSLSKEIFNETNSEYETDLKKSGYHNGELKSHKEEQNNQKRKRSRNIIWFKPLLNKDVTKNVAKTFIYLLDKHFPKSRKLHKICSKNTVKVSYCYTESLCCIIRSHKKDVINGKKAGIVKCSCRNKSLCPRDSNCQQNDVIYKCIVSTCVNPDKVHLGTAEGDFKKRCYNRNKSFTHCSYVS